MGHSGYREGEIVRWVAGRYEDMHERLQKRVLQIRGQRFEGPGHARTPAAIGELRPGWEMFLRFALEAGAIGPAETEALEQRIGSALADLAQRQAKYQVESDPALHFLTLLQAALGGGSAHVVDRQGRMPAQANAWGWQQKNSGRGWEPRGTRIGWVAGSDLFLEPTASYQVAQELAGAERLPVAEQKLRQCLREHGVLASIDTGRQMLMGAPDLGRPVETSAAPES